ncbi:MAG: LamG domain-containing protein [Candidatus Thermoplasmatota archaeon]|nr:LamG domain-containing protein [Candidatus Thermoplasmatota archaeon]
MKKHTSLHNTDAISQIVGSAILLIIAVLCFTAIYSYVFPLPEYVADSNIVIQGSLSGSYESIQLIHAGGEPIREYQIFVDNKLYKNGFNWTMDGNPEYIPFEANKKMDVLVIAKTSDGGTEVIFKGEFFNPLYNEKPTHNNPYIYTSLLKNTTSEDIICKKNGPSIDSDGDNITYIYTWYKNGESFAKLYLPFNTNSPTETNDYSGANNNGIVSGATWVDTGNVGGCYQFIAPGDEISSSLPSVFTDLSTNDFAITVWIKSDNIGNDGNCVLEAYYDNQNFVQIFQNDNRIYTGVQSGNEQYILKTGPLDSNRWYHLGVLWDSSSTTLRLFVNGLEYDTKDNEFNLIPGDDSYLSIGQKTNGSDGWIGLIDELYVYNQLISDATVYQEYLCARDGSSDVSVIVSEETSTDDQWYCIVTPNDSYQDGIAKQAISSPDNLHLITIG